MARFERVASTRDIPLGEMKGFRVGYQRLVIAHTEGGFFAVVDECSHDSAPISDGQVLGHEVVCARHGARFDLKTGAVGELPGEEIEEAWEEQPRLTVPVLPADERKSSFDEVELIFPEEKARQEAKRCLRCDLES